MPSRPRLIFLLFAPILLAAAPFAQKIASPEAAKRAAPAALLRIEAETLSEHAHELASAAYEGRLTGTPGQQRAERYFIERFEQWGLEPFGDERPGSQGEATSRAWTQSYDIRLNGVRQGTTGLFDAKKKPVIARGAWFLSHVEEFETTGKLELRGEVADGLGDVDLHGRIPVFHLPIEGGEGGMGRGFQLGQKIQAQLRGLAKDVKAAKGEAVIVLTEEIPSWMLSVMMYMGLVTPGRPEVRLGHGNQGPNRRFRFGGGPAVPCVLVSGDEAMAVLRELGMRRTPIAKAVRHVGKASRDTLTLRVDPLLEETQANNVIGLLRGRDPQLADEALVYSCHMDHLGLAADGRIFYGADDNASGCATVLEIAEAFSKLEGDERPRRSILFLVVSGEELGLWGSGHFVEHPTWPLAKIVANVNMDMLGRSTKDVPSDAIALTPTHGHSGYNELARDAAFLGKAFGLRMADGDKFYARSDQYNFAKRGIPVVFFCDDEHPDYHQVTDTPDKLEYDKLERVARLAFLLAHRWTLGDDRPRALGRQGSWFGR